MSSLHPTTRHILQTLSGFMGQNGDHCFPSIIEVAKRSGRDRGTVSDHIAKAEAAGWLRVDSKGWTGPQHARKSFIARWPDSMCADQVEGVYDDGSALAPDAGAGPDRCGAIPHQDEAQSSTYKTSPPTSPNNPSDKTSAGADGSVERKRIRAHFLKWLASYPNFEHYSDSEARKWWFKLSEDDRRDCIRLSPAYFQWMGKRKLPSPQHFLRDKAWTEVPAGSTARPELIEAKAFSPLWMLTRFSMLFQPPTGTIVLTIFDRNRTDKTQEEVRLQKLAVSGWPNVNAMMKAMKEKQPTACPTALEPLTAGFKSVKKDGDLYEAWSRLHARRGWPFFSFVPNYVPFPAIDLGVVDLDAAVEAAIAELETQISKV
ncbi:helix-turn-helix domain-containing protein (plasmid) [Agrobacterium rosae]|uniref:Helix-turn-helix domain-containing protein n=1 Tax=Agrobacterium rosae TaxID=1972867 RepID=A0ABU4W4Y3_9HYPH|nr:helix-turn-helix domain-containing protein [Agrobacterium rosae]MDX8332857.1 helix-turn-helix domain-containing protein [Agrobacterium rosae]